MNRDYTFKNTNTISFMYDSSIENIVRRYDMTLQAASKVILPLLNSTSFFLKLRSEEYLDNTMKFVFEAVSSNQILTLTILNDIFIIEHQDEMYVYSFDWDRNNLYLRLESFTKKLKEKENLNDLKQKHRAELDKIANSFLTEDSHEGAKEKNFIDKLFEKVLGWLLD